MHPDQEPAHPDRHRTDDCAEPGPAIGVHVVEIVADPPQPGGLHGPGVDLEAEMSVAVKRQGQFHVGHGRGLARGGGRRGGRRGDPGLGRVEREHGGDEVLRLHRDPLERDRRGRWSAPPSVCRRVVALVSVVLVTTAMCRMLSTVSASVFRIPGPMPTRSVRAIGTHAGDLPRHVDQVIVLMERVGEINAQSALGAGQVQGCWSRRR